MGCYWSSRSTQDSTSIIDISMDPFVDTSRLANMPVPIVCIIGGPGVDKTRLGKSLAAEFGLTSITCSELIRLEVSADTERGKKFKKIMLKGRNIPGEVVFKMIQQKMLEFDESPGFMIIGFPRTKHEARLLRSQIKNPDLVLYIWASKQMLEDKMSGRIVANDRFDDTEEAVHVRIKKFLRNIEDIIRIHKNFVTVVDGQKSFNDILQACFNAVNIVLTKHNYYQQNRPT